MKKFKDLGPEDFPGVNPQKFSEWKTAVLKTRGHVYILLVIYLILNIKSYGVTGNIIYDTPIVLFIGALFVSQHGRFASERHTTYIIASLCLLIMFDIVVVRMTEAFVGESLLVIVAFFWLYSQNRKNKELETAAGIKVEAIKRSMSE
ncbi:MAG TPA: hypothetical protein VLZ07_11715 [Syntrophales bacterium]|nr:hypothetical protein [Syntrophales bacterium]